MCHHALLSLPHLQKKRNVEVITREDDEFNPTSSSSSETEDPNDPNVSLEELKKKKKERKREKRKKDEEAKENELPPLLARVNGKIEVRTC